MILRGSLPPERVGRDIASSEPTDAQLRVLSGEDFGKDADTWLTWLREHVDRLQPSPWTTRIDYAFPPSGAAGEPGAGAPPS